MAAAVLTPPAVASTLLDVWPIRRGNTERFITILYVLMTVVGLELLSRR